MQTKAAVDFVDSIIKAGKVEQVVNAILNATCTKGIDEDMFLDKKLKDIIDSLKTNKSFCNMTQGITDRARGAYHFHRVDLNTIINSTLLVGFLAGAQFALDGGKAEHKHTDALEHTPTPPKSLVN